ncbi:MAG: ankyrin repeat domain-containing protein [Gammaproteobacteria bacterium]|nr:ankyrin repeat domain-containing protein [Gammaproteobacteria bacterium]
MRVVDPINRVQSDFFFREEPKLDLSHFESSMIIAALGQTPERWQGYPNTERMGEIVSQHPHVLDNIGPRLLNTMVGMKGCGPAIAFLIEHNVPFQMPQDVYNQMHEGAWCDAVDSLQALFESGVVDATCVSVKKPHLGWPDNISLMYWAAYRGSVDMATLLIKYGVRKHHELRMKSNGERGETSLQEAVAPPKLGTKEEHLTVAKLLIDDGAYYDIGSASALDDVTRVEELLAEDPSLSHKPLEFGMTALHWSSRAGAESTTQLLLDQNANPNALNRSHRTPIQLAAEMDQANVVTLLATSGADLNTQDKKGRTPLHRATYEGKVSAAEALLANGADPNITNKNGKTAFEIARKEAKIFKNALS